jgi:glycopeptide antibiotics resistance protein
MPILLATPMASRTGSRLASAFLGYLLGVVVLVTLVPFDFSSATEHRLLWGGSLPDALSNVAMFVPLGFLFRLTRNRDAANWALHSLIWAIGFSALLEAAQLYLPSRFSSPLDVATNGLGAWLGAIAHDLIVQRIRLTPALVGALALELPVMGLVYLLVPLLWLSGLASAGGEARMGLSLLLGLIGAVVLGAIHRNRLAPAGIGVAKLSAIAGGWDVIGAIPGFVEHPLIAAASAMIVAGATALWAGRWGREDTREDRRFEGETLRRLAPFLGLYLVALAGWPPGAAFVSWHGELGWNSLWGSADTTMILRALEHFAAFTVVGYAVAESRGRRERPFVRSVATVVLWGTGISAILELVAALQPGVGASLARGALSVVLAVYGGGIYHLQRTHIRWLIGPAPLVERPDSAATLHPGQTAQIEVPALAGQRG